MLLSDRIVASKNDLCSPWGWGLGRVRETVPISCEYLIRMGRKSTQASLFSPEKAGVKD